MPLPKRRTFGSAVFCFVNSINLICQTAPHSSGAVLIQRRRPMKAFMTARKTGMQIISFKLAPQDNNPLARIEKRHGYFWGANREDHVSIADMGIREIRSSVQEIKRLAAKKPGLESARSPAPAGRLTANLGSPLWPTPMRDHASLPDPSTCSSA